MAKGYKFMDHTADVEFVAYGKTVEELFKNALLAQFDTIADIKKLVKAKGRGQTFKISETAATLEDLFWFVLQDALSIADSQGLYGYDIAKTSLEIGLNIYEANIVVKAREKKTEFSKLDVKGVSRFDLKIKKKGKGLEASAVLDV